MPQLNFMMGSSPKQELSILREQTSMVNYLQRAFTLKSIAVNLTALGFCYLLVGTESVTRCLLGFVGVLAFYGIGCAHGWDAGFNHFFKQLEKGGAVPGSITVKGSFTVRNKDGDKYEVRSD